MGPSDAELAELMAGLLADPRCLDRSMRDGTRRQDVRALEGGSRPWFGDRGVHCLRVEGVARGENRVSETMTWKVLSVVAGLHSPCEVPMNECGQNAPRS
jgi:hypothetical protein